eukprot:gene7403-15122_t
MITKFYLRSLASSLSTSTPIRFFSSKGTKTSRNQLTNRSTPNNEVEVSESWMEVMDPKGSGKSYWWNKKTNETTVLGAPKPENWKELKDPAGSDLTYWWNPETNATTALGQAPPYRELYKPVFPINSSRYQPQSFGGVMMYSMALGFGVSLAFTFVRVFIENTQINSCSGAPPRVKITFSLITDGDVYNPQGWIVRENCKDKLMNVW